MRMNNSRRRNSKLNDLIHQPKIKEDPFISILFYFLKDFLGKTSGFFSWHTGNLFQAQVSISGVQKILLCLQSRVLLLSYC